MNKLLFCSSFLFLLPTFFAYQSNHYIHSFVVGIATILSCKYWSNPNDKFWHLADIFASRIAGTWWAIYAMLYNTKDNIIHLYFLFASICCYLTSKQLHKANYHKWYYFHFLFHIFIISASVIYIT